MIPQSSAGAATAAARSRRISPSRYALIALAAVMTLLIAIQFVPYGRDHSNPPVFAEPAWDSAQTRALFFRACGDCHSNQTAWPWYSNLAPVSWLVQRDVQEGRAAFNVSEWGRAENESDDAAETIQDGTMPPWFYVALHASARLSPAERAELASGLSATFGGETENEDNHEDDHVEK